MTVSEVLRRVTSALDHSAIPYMVVGSFASSAYGATRSTQDIDIVINATAQQLQAFVKDLGDDYYADPEAALEALANRSMFNVIDQTLGWKIDLIIPKDRAYSREAFRRRRQVDIPDPLDLSIFVASPEDVIISKLEWAKLGQSHRQIEDVVAILQRRFETLDLSYMQKWITELELQAQWNSARKADGVPE
jgi:hypothetical protein